MPVKQLADNAISFIDSPVVAGNPDKYTEITVSTAKTLKSWRESLYSFEWVLPDGRIKSADELKDSEKEKRLAVESLIADNLSVEKPVLGIGLLENVEIGSGRAVFLTLADYGLQIIPVHVPTSNIEEFEAFLP